MNGIAIGDRLHEPRLTGVDLASELSVLPHVVAAGLPQVTKEPCIPLLTVVPSVY
jgi:hypothetical protein